MKKNYFIVLMICIGAFIGCGETTAPVLQNSNTYNAISLGNGGDCKKCLVKFVNYSGSLDSLAGATAVDSVYYALNLPQSLIPSGTRMTIEFRKPNNDERLNCPTFGPAYGEIFILNSRAD